ncbi:14624_t:CDS:10 [Gigaspora margarita]|uniref:14624_t:CDS:1 n=1 Tax=Gigaspora margarita TaxID=4874 RepID=A0ABN7UGW2_GIGMA|nr:14624_t:CDS:10 [Gigaspora margarita]
MAVCFILGDPVTKKFVIEINPEMRKTKRILHIREIIINDNVNFISGIDPRKIKLWKVTISTSERNEKLEVLNRLNIKIDIEKELEGVFLPPEDEICKHFDEQLTSGHIHIIVQPHTRSLGGTTYWGKEHGDAYEVRSPPMTGKTARAQLLEHNLLQSDKVKKGLKRVFRAKDYKPENEDEPRHGGEVFWNSFKFILQCTRLHIVAFASYGHYGAYTSRGDHAIMDMSPCTLPKSNTWKFEDVRFTREEFNCYFNQFCEKNLQISFTMNQIQMKFVKHTFEPLTFAKVFTYLKSRDFNDHFKVNDIRAMPKITDMLDEEKRIADTTNILVDIRTTKGGYSTIDFPAPLLRATYLQNRFGNDCRLLERVWQMEFYRASMQVLPADIYASIDVGAVFGSEGYLDFYVNDQHNWTVELLRDGDKLQEQRYQKDGRYTSILKYAKEWAIIDIRNSKKGSPEQKGKGLIYPDGTKDHVRLLGEDENLLGIINKKTPRPSPGPHKLRECLSLVIFLRNRLKYALIKKEVQSVLMQCLVKVDDVITIEKNGENFRLIYDAKGRFTIHKITSDEATYKLAKVKRVQFGAKGIQPMMAGNKPSISLLKGKGVKLTISEERDRSVFKKLNQKYNKFLRARAAHQ